jgi:hypothetical protein
MKTIELKVTIEFEDDISSDNELSEVAENVKNALVHDCDNGIGLAPENSETFTKEITVFEIYNETTHKERF